MVLEMTGWLSWVGSSWLKLTEDNEGGIKAGKLGEEIEGALLEYPKEGGEEKAEDWSPLYYCEIKEETFLQTAVGGSGRCENGEGWGCGSPYGEGWRMVFTIEILVCFQTG